MSKMRILFCLGLFMATATLAICYSMKDMAPTASSTEFASLSPDTPYRGPLDDCLQNSIIYGFKSRLKSECATNYVHFTSEKANPQSALTYQGAVKIASFNLFHLGDNQAPIKNLKLMATIMNQWDLVGAQEMMPLPQEWSGDNQKIFRLVNTSGNGFTFPDDKWEAMAPGYLRLLEELQDLDNNWSLILQPMPEGEGSSGEMAGFYYRANKVTLKEWDYCPQDGTYDIKTSRRLGNYGCVVQVPTETRRLMSRVGFTAYFQSGTFDFAAVTTHVRFRPADSAADLQAQKDILCAKHEDPAKCSPTKDEVGRFFEVSALLAESEKIRRAAGDRDIIYSGDLNLQDDKKSKGMWNATLNFAPGFAITQTQLTTLSVKSGKLVSNYDHFILDGQNTSECSLESAKAFDFTSFENSNTPVFQAIKESMTLQGQQALKQQYRDRLDKIAKFQAGKKNAPDSIRGLSEKELADFSDGYERALKRMSENKYGVLMEQLSDHIPVEISCKTPPRDDD